MPFHFLLTSGITFAADEEYLELRFRVLNSLMLVGLLSTGLFIGLDWTGINSLGHRQLAATQANLLLTALLMVALRNRKQLLRPISTTFILVNLMTYTSALIWVTNDELRVLWFHLAVMFSYVLLGSRSGLTMTALSIGLILMAQPLMAPPFTPNALTTLIISLLVTGFGAFTYTRRSESAFERLRMSNIELRALASRDPLTGLLNPRAFGDIANQLIRISQRKGQTASMLFIDLDHFKHINDQYGHATGDVVLRAVAQELGNHTRKSDVLGRIGGEEFLFFLPDTSADSAREVAEKLRLAIEAMRIPLADDTQLQVSASIGVSQSLPADSTVATIQRRADQAMYLAKAQGRNRVAG